MTRLIEEKGLLRLAAALLTILLAMSLITIGTGSGVEAFTASQRSSLKASDIQVSRERLLKSAAAHIKRGQALGYGYSQVMTGTNYVPLASFTDGFCCVDLVTHVVYTATASMINNRYHSIDQTLATAHAFSASNGLVFDTRAVSTLRSQLTAIPALYQSLGNNVNPSSLQLGDIVLTGNRDDSSANHCVFVIGKVTAAENAFMQIPSFNASTSYFLNMSSSSTRASYQSASRFNTYWDASDPNKGFYIKQAYRPLFDMKGQDLGGFGLKKTDASTGAGLTGAVFLLTGPDGFSQEFTMTSSEYQSGKVYKPGSYTLREITAPHGYLLDSTSRSLTIGFDEINQTYHTAPIKNTADKGKVKIIKKDAGTGTTIKNAVFELSQSASFPSNATHRLTTGSDGSATSPDLILGQGATVYVREYSVPSPYLLDSSVKQIALKRGQTVTLNVQNARAQGRIEITKEGQDKAKIKGATFSVKNASGTTVANLTTGSDGKATTSVLPLGRYTVMETGVPAPYLLNSTPKTVDLTYKNQTTPLVTATVIFTNEKAQGRIEIHKVNEDHEPVEGARFELEDESGSVLYTLTTGSDGKVSTPSLPLGSYRVREIFVPNPYILDEEPRQVSLVYQGQTVAMVLTTVTVPNLAARGRLRLTKTCQLTGEPLEGVSFEIRDGEGNPRDLLVTDEEGYAESRELPLGRYQLIELETAQGYVLDETPRFFDLVYESMSRPLVTVSLELDNEPILGRIRIEKLEKDSHIPIPGAVFELLDEEGEPALDYEGEPVPLLVSDQEGLATSPELRYGCYTIREVETPASYYLNQEDYEVTIDQHEQLVELVIPNEKVMLFIQVNKFDGQSLEPLQGATFDLIKEEGEEESLAATGLVTDENGQASTDTALPTGDYRLVEVAPPQGYSSGEDQHFSISRETGDLLLERGSQTIALHADNRPVELEFSKRNMTGDEELPGATLQVTDRETGDLIDRWVSSDQLHLLTHLVINRTYLFEELEAPPGYQLAQPIEVTVEDTEERRQVVMRNELTQLVIEKRDEENNKLLSEAIFELQDIKGNPIHFSLNKETGIYRWMPEPKDSNPALTTDDEGRIEIRGLPCGDYQLLETQAPKGHIRPEEVTFFSMPRGDESRECLYLQVKNQESKITIEKIDAESKKPLQGALLQIFDEKNEVVGSGKTDKQGQLTLTGLDPGNYSVKELTAPKGYERSDQVIAFSLDEWGKTDRELVMKNCRARVPSAGTSPITIYLLPAVLATGIGTLILLILKRRLRVDN